MIIKIIGTILYVGGILITLWGLYVFIPTILGLRNDISFVGAIAGIGILATLGGFVSFLIGRWLLK
jgi:hypothetical protein